MMKRRIVRNFITCMITSESCDEPAYAILIGTNCL